MGLDQKIIRTDHPDLTDALLNDNPDVNLDNLQAWIGRKENHIHEWISRSLGSEIENLEYHSITQDQMQNLISDIETVLADHSRAPELLPTRAGFFFGGTDYDEWYFSDLAFELEQFKSLTAFELPDTQYHYWAWW